MAPIFHTTRPRRALRLAAPVLAGLLLLSACGKKDEPATQSGASSSSNSSTTTTAAGNTSGTAGTTTGTGNTTGTGVPGAVALVKTVWYNGFKISLSDPTIDETKQVLKINAEVENLGEDPATLYGTYYIETEGTQGSTGYWEESKNILGKAKAKEVLEVPIDDDFDQEKSVLVFGAATEQQVRLSLKEGGTDVVLQPVAQELKGPITVGVISYNIDKTEVRYDRIDNHDQAKKEHVYLVMTGTAKNTSDEETIYFNENQFQLASPDGTTAAATRIGTEGSINATQKDDKTIWSFDIADPFAGEYTLTITGDFAGTGEDVTVEQKFTLVATK